MKEEADLAASLIACSLTVNVTSLPDAAVEINVPSPLILKDTLPSFNDLAVVDVPLSSAKAIVWAMFAVFVAILLPNTVFVLLIALATSLASATPAVPVAVPSALAVRVPLATSIVIV